MSSSRRGLLFIVSAPSGTGKTTLVERLVQVVPRLRLSRSYTSRSARAGEQDGVGLQFHQPRAVRSDDREQAFLEWADVFGNYYGTSAADTEQFLAAGEDVVLVIDVQGARQVRARGIETVGVFVLPPSAGRARIAAARTQQGHREQIRRRLEVARTEVGEFEQYEYVVVNDDLDGAGEPHARHRHGRARAHQVDARRRRDDHRDVPAEAVS
jgi:guanylate kinase